jgi:hypothetical protein
MGSVLIKAGDSKLKRASEFSTICAYAGSRIGVKVVFNEARRQEAAAQRLQKVKASKGVEHFRHGGSARIGSEEGYEPVGCGPVC